VRQAPGLVPQAAGILHQHIPQGRGATVLSLVADGVFLAEVLGSDDEVGHRKFQVLRFKC
jgi:hypothetical protein